MKKLLIFLQFLAIPLLAAPLHVVATLPSLAALTKDVGGELVEVQSLTSPRQDPHYADAKPSLIVVLNRADLLVLNGLELEVGWLPPLLLQARNAKIQRGAPGYVDVSHFVHLLGVPTGPLDRALGDVHPGGNPHFAADPRAGAQMARAIGRALAQLDPPHAADFQTRAGAVAQQLEAYAKQETSRFASLPAEKRTVVVYHDSLVYLMDWLDMREAATLEPRPGIPPNPGHVAEVLQLMKQKHIPAIAQEEFYPQNPGKTVSQLAGAKLVVLPGGARFPEQTYVDFVKSVANALHAALVP